MVTLASQGHEFKPRNSHEKSQGWWHVPVVLVLEEWKQEDLWGSMASQPSLLDEFQAIDRPCLKKQNNKAKQTKLPQGRWQLKNDT